MARVGRAFFSNKSMAVASLHRYSQGCTPTPLLGSRTNRVQSNHLTMYGIMIYKCKRSSYASLVREVGLCISFTTFGLCNGHCVNHKEQMRGGRK